MGSGNSLKMLYFAAADAAALYASLYITLFIRYGSGFYYQFNHTLGLPFTFLFILWILVFYIAGLYDLRRLRNNLDFLKTLYLCIGVNAALSIVLFYLVPAFGVTPKTNLVIFVVIFFIIESFWRRLLNRATTFTEASNRVLMIGNGQAGTEAKHAVRENPLLGYEIRAELGEEDAYAAADKIKEIAARENINLIVISSELKQAPKLVAALYDLFSRGILVMDVVDFYELVMRKVPLAEIRETWFLENIAGDVRFYDPLKRTFELCAALVIGLVLLPFEVLIAILVALTSRGPIIYRQVRVGTHGHEFTLYKFRSMRDDAEKNGATWAQKNDARTTPIGGILRASHLDELPQLWNIIRGDLSFVGPRPERPEFVKALAGRIPYYEARLFVKPGVTGWAQINHRADITDADVIQKLQYDIYYLKNRSPILDLAIILRTLKTIFVNPE